VPCARFEIPACAAADVGRLQHELGVSGPLAQVLVRRGYAEPAARGRSWQPTRSTRPEAFAGIGEAVVERSSLTSRAAS
jgi:hypothetical protein